MRITWHQALTKRAAEQAAAEAQARDTRATLDRITPLAAKGFVHTRVIPVENPNRFWLGTTTPREMHDLLWRLATKTLLKPASCDFLLGVTRGLSGYHDGVRQ